MGKVEQVEILNSCHKITINVSNHVSKQIQTTLLWNVKYFLNFFFCTFFLASSLFFFFYYDSKTFNDIKKREYTRGTLKQIKNTKKNNSTNEYKILFHDLPSIVSLIFHSFLSLVIVGFPCNKDFTLVVSGSTPFSSMK